MPKREWSPVPVLIIGMALIYAGFHLAYHMYCLYKSAPQIEAVVLEYIPESSGGYRKHFYSVGTEHGIRKVELKHEKIEIGTKFTMLDVHDSGKIFTSLSRKPSFYQFLSQDNWHVFILMLWIVGSLISYSSICKIKNKL